VTSLNFKIAYGMACGACGVRSYRAMAQRTGLAARCLQNLVAGRTDPRLSTLEALGGAAGVPVSTVLLWAEGRVDR
jgi:hypothetical protein